MSNQGWNNILAAMNLDDSGLEYKRDQLQNRIKAASKDYSSFNFLLKKTGRGIDAQKKCFTGSVEVRSECKKPDPNCGKFFKKNLAHFDLLDMLLS
jgi:Myb/SANT-like DNA-binding domain